MWKFPSRFPFWPRSPGFRGRGWARRGGHVWPRGLLARGPAPGAGGRGAPRSDRKAAVPFDPGRAGRREPVPRPVAASRPRPRGRPAGRLREAGDPPGRSVAGGLVRPQCWIWAARRPGPWAHHPFCPLAGGKGRSTEEGPARKPRGRLAAGSAHLWPSWPPWCGGEVAASCVLSGAPRSRGAGNREAGPAGRARRKEGESPRPSSAGTASAAGQRGRRDAPASAHLGPEAAAPPEPTPRRSRGPKPGPRGVRALSCLRTTPAPLTEPCCTD